MKPSRLAHIVSEVLCKSVGVDCFLSGLHKGNVSQMFVTGRISDSFCHLTPQLSIRKCVGPAVDHLIAEVPALPFLFFLRELCLPRGKKNPTHPRASVHPWMKLASCAQILFCPSLIYG